MRPSSHAARRRLQRGAVAKRTARLKAVRRARLLTAVAAAVLAAAPAAQAITRSWIAGSGNWNTVGSWNPSGVPAAGDSARVSASDGVHRIVTYDYTGPALTLTSV